MRKGKILAFHGSWQSGLAQLEIQDSETGAVELVPCDNAPTVRALASAFPDVIGSGHTVNQKAIAGKEIYWSLDVMGLVLGGFTPVKGAPRRVTWAYKNQRKAAAR